MQGIRSLNQVGRLAIGIFKPGCVSNHLHTFNLATCSFALRRDKNRTELRNPKPLLHQTSYGSLFLNNGSFKYQLTFSQFISTKPNSLSNCRDGRKTERPHRHRKPGKIFHSKSAHSDSKNNIPGKKQSSDQLLQGISSEQPGPSDPGVKSKQTESAEKDEVPEEQSLSVFQRFKRAYKEHGKILIGVHLVTSSVWFGTFFYAAKMGVDIVPLLESWGFSETITKPFKSSNLGNVALAYLMYKLATPARYTVTLGGTNLVIRYFRKTGKMSPVQEGDSLRELYKDSKDHLQQRRHKLTSDLRERRLKAVKDGRRKHHKKH